MSITHFWKRSYILVSLSEESSQTYPEFEWSGKISVDCTEIEIHSLKLSIKIPNLLAVLRCNWYIINCTHLKWYTVFDKFWHMYMFNEDNKHIHQLLKVSLCPFMSLLHPLSLAPHLWATTDMLSVNYGLVCFIPFVETICKNSIFCLGLLYYEVVEGNSGKGLCRRTIFFFP